MDLFVVGKSITSFELMASINWFYNMQVEHENSRARDLLYQAPFLIPFTHRVRIYTVSVSQSKCMASYKFNEFFLFMNHLAYGYLTEWIWGGILSYTI